MFWLTTLFSEVCTVIAVVSAFLNKCFACQMSTVMIPSTMTNLNPSSFDVFRLYYSDGQE